jgi:hypothetical protein
LQAVEVANAAGDLLRASGGAGHRGEEGERQQPKASRHVQKGDTVFAKRRSG